MSTTSSTPKVTLLKALASALREAMSQEGVNISRMAKDAGVSRNQLYQIANEENQPKISTAEKIAEYLGKTITLK